jgi:transcriptional regulator with XRE-family HTH domain
MRLKYLRIGKGWSQTELANIAKVRQSALSKIESGASDGFSAKSMKAVADALGVAVFDVDEFKEKMDSPPKPRVRKTSTPPDNGPLPAS